MIAAAGGQTYAIPYPKQRAQPEQAMPQQPEQSPWQTPMGEDLAYVENLTSNYYNAYGTLKDFTTTMWKDYGVDVTKPDFSQPGGGDLHQAYLAMDAELRMTANDLAQQRKSTEEKDKLQAQGKLVRGTYIDPATGKTVSYDPTKELERQFGPEGQNVSPYVSTELNDTTLKAIEKAQQTYYDTGDVNAANESLQPIKDEYARLMQDDPYNKEYYQRQLKAIMNATKTTPAIAFRPPSARSGQVQTIADISNKIVKDNTGFGWTPERVKYKYIDGKTVPTITPEQQTSHGKTTIVTRDPSGKEKKEDVEKIVAFYYMKDGAVYARYAGVLASPTYDERTDNKLASEQVNQFFENNPKYGSTALASEAMSPYRTSETGGVTIDSFLTPEEKAQGEQIKNEVKANASRIDQLVQAEKDKIKEQYKKTESAGFFGGIDFPLTIKGKEVKFTGKIGGSNIDLEGGKDTYRSITGEDVIPAGIRLTNMNIDQFVNLLEKFGYFDDIVEQASGAAFPSAMPTNTPAVAPSGGAPPSKWVIKK